jgi:hypothetical protein
MAQKVAPSKGLALSFLPYTLYTISLSSSITAIVYWSLIPSKRFNANLYLEAVKDTFLLTCCPHAADSYSLRVPLPLGWLIWVPTVAFIYSELKKYSVT